MNVFIVAALLCMSLAACTIEPADYHGVGGAYGYRGGYGDSNYNGHHHSDWR